MLFYKGVKKSDLEIDHYIPGTVTTSKKIAQLWKERLESKKKKGVHKHLKKGPSCIIVFNYDETNLLTHEEFQRCGVKEHHRGNCWLSTMKDKAQINTPVKYRIV